MPTRRTIRPILLLAVISPLLTLLISIRPLRADDKAPPTEAPAPLARLAGVHRILFIGDSITYAGGYVDDIDAWLVTHLPDRRFELLDLGLSSETASGLSEKEHPYPRPDVHERLDRALRTLAAENWKPDLVFACYGMNDGIYHPFAEDRFARYQDGMRRLVERVKADGVPVVILTPPPYDARPAQAHHKALPDGAGEYGYSRPYEKYDDVLARYGQWLLEQRVASGWQVIDLHGPMAAYLTEHEKSDPTFALAADGVHPGDAGHWVMAEQVLKYLGFTVAPDLKGEPPVDELGGKEKLALIAQRRKILCDAWLTRIGHKRPGLKPGLPLNEATQKAEELEEQIHPLIKPGDDGHPKP